MSEYFRCQHTDDDKRQCENWFLPADVEAIVKLCPHHINSLSLKSNEPQAKANYIDTRNAELTIVKDMTVDQLDQHIAGLEAEIEVLKARVMTSRANRADKVQKLSDEERAKRQRITFDSTGTRIERPERQRAKAPSKPTLKSDPVGYLMATYPTLTREQAEKMAGLK